MKTAIADIGSNSVRLAVIQNGETLYKRLATTRLGEGLTQSGIINEEAINRTVIALNNFYKKSQQEGCDSYSAFATAAVRSAKNREHFLRRIDNECGICVEVISGETESRLGILGALNGEDGGIIDVGGASTEVNIRHGGKSVYSKSVDVGTVRAFDMAGRDYAKLEKYILGKISEYGDFKAETKMKAIGGTATTMASVKHGLEIYDPKITDGTKISRDEALQMSKRLLSMSVEDVEKVKGMEIKRADLIGGGCLILALVMKKFSIEEITVSESDNIEGYYLEKYVKRN